MRSPRLARLALSSVVLGMIAAGAACGGDDSVQYLDAGGQPDAAARAPLDATTSMADTGTDATLATPDASDGASAADSAQAADAADASDASDASDANDGAIAVDRGPTTIPFSGDPTGLDWEYGTGNALYIADDANNRVVQWTDAHGFAAIYNLPALAPDAGGGVGQPARLIDGTMYVPRVGMGNAGNIFVVDRTGDAGPLPFPDGGFSVKKRRMGFLVMPDNSLLDTYFQPLEAGSGTHVGAVATVKPSTSEKDLITGLAKPVGVVFNENRLYVTDQDLGLVLQVLITGGVYTPDAGPVDSGMDADDGSGNEAGADASDGAPVDSGPVVDAGSASVFATIPGADLLCQGPNGSLFVGSLAGSVYQIARNGTVTTFASGLKSARGCAYDGAHDRLFVAEHDPAGVAHAIRIFPVP